ncbi:hypothetical protein [Photorhabdus viridis]
MSDLADDISDMNLKVMQIQTNLASSLASGIAQEIRILEGA